jgi:hypothetical protein
MWSLHDYRVITLRPNSADTTRRTHLQSDNRCACMSTFPTQADPALIACVIARNEAKTFRLARFHGMPPRADPLGRSGGSPDGVAERSTAYRSSKDWLRPSAGRSLLALYGIAFEEQRLADECRNCGFLIRLGNQECRLRPFAGEKAFRICGNKDHRDLECGE